VIIAVVNNKGGVGKTTVTCNLAHALGLLGQSVLVVDLDPQCNATSLLLSTGGDRQHSLYELLAHERLEPPLARFIYPSRYDGVSCLPNVPETASVEPEMILQAPASLFRLRRHLRAYALQHFDFVIIDNPPNLGSMVICALNTADFALVPVQAGSAFSVTGLLQAVRLINAVRTKDNKDLKSLRILINHVDKRTLISRTLTEQIFGAFRKDQICRTTIPGNTAFEQAEAAGATILRWNPSAPGARAFRELAQELLDIFAGSRNHPGREARHVQA
ncbi:MAG: ParA family protein, partial [Desulfobaccales bacterium]